MAHSGRVPKPSFLTQWACTLVLLARPQHRRSSGGRRKGGGVWQREEEREKGEGEGEGKITAGWEWAVPTPSWMCTGSMWAWSKEGRGSVRKKGMCSWREEYKTYGNNSRSDPKELSYVWLYRLLLDTILSKSITDIDYTNSCSLWPYWNMLWLRNKVLSCNWFDCIQIFLPSRHDLILSVE